MPKDITSDVVTPRGDDGTAVPGTGAVPDDYPGPRTVREDAGSDLSVDPGAPTAEQTPPEPEPTPEPEPQPAPASEPEPQPQPTS